LYFETGYSTVLGRCIPVDNNDGKFMIDTVVSGGLKSLLGIVANFTDTDDQKYQEVAVHCSREISRLRADTFTDKCWMAHTY
jgi:hypothetical protein